MVEKSIEKYDSTIVIITKTKKEVKVSMNIVNMSTFLADTFRGKENDYNDPLYLPELDPKVLGRIKVYCQHHKFEKVKTDLTYPLPPSVKLDFIKDFWEHKFMTDLLKDGAEMIINLMNAAYDLGINALFELCAATAAA